MWYLRIHRIVGATQEPFFLLRFSSTKNPSILIWDSIGVDSISSQIDKSISPPFPFLANLHGSE